MQSGRARRGRAWVVSGIVATAVVIGGGGPAPGQVPEDPEVVFVDAYGPMLFGYEDCDGVVHTEGDPVGWISVELDAEVGADVAVALSFGGDLAADLVDAPTELVVPAGESWGEVELAFDEVATGELTVTVEPGIGYTADLDDTYTLEVSAEPEIVASCTADIGDSPDGTDRQTILVGQQPVPLGFFIEEGEPPTTGPTSTSTTSTTTEPVEQDASGFSRLRSLRALPRGYSTPIANGSLPPGLTYENDTWGGAATTTGLYAFDVRVCLDRTAVTLPTGRQGDLRRPLPKAFPTVVCFGQVDVQIAVLAADPAPPAEPVDADARFAG